MRLGVWLLTIGLCSGLVASDARAQAYKAPSEPHYLMNDELSELERRRAQLSLGGPIAFTIVGGVAAVTGGMFLLLGLALEAVETCSSYEMEIGDSCEGFDGTPFVILGAVGLVGGLVTLAIAVPMLFDRSEERRELGLRIQQLRRERYGGARWSPEGPRLARSATLLKLRF